MGFEYRPGGGNANVDVKNRQVKVPWTTEQLTKVFKSHDSNNDGQLSWDELKAAFKYLGSRCSYFRTGKAIDYSDENNDGFIDLSNIELPQLVQYAHSCGYKVF